MAVYTDNFDTGSPNDDLDVYDSTWVDVGPDADTIEIVGLGGPARGIGFDTNSNGGYLYNQTFNSKHYAELEIVDDGALGPTIRTAAGGNFYYCLAGTGAVYNGDCVSGSYSDWDGGQAGISVNDVVALYVDATTETTILYKVNDSTIQTYTSKSALSGGKPGVSIYLGGEGDNWEGGDVEVAAGGDSIPYLISKNKNKMQHLKVR